MPEPSKQAVEAAVERLRGIGYPCQVWYNNHRLGIVISLEAAENLIRHHQPPKPEADYPALLEQARSEVEGEVRERLQSVVERLERIRDIDEQTSDGALGSLARYALDDLDAALSPKEDT